MLHVSGNKINSGKAGESYDLVLLLCSIFKAFECDGRKTALIGKRDKSVLTWIVFGVDLLRPVAVEGDSVLCCSTGTTVEQRFVCGVSIQGLCSDKSRKRRKRVKMPDTQTTWRPI